MGGMSKRTLNLARVTKVTSVAGGASADRAIYPPRTEVTDGRLVDSSVPDHRRNVRMVPPELTIARLRSALKALLLEAKSDQHRRDRGNLKCPPMEAAIEKAEAELARRLR
jgi:hypothetical protein